jgi:hypothetical protein
MGRTNRPLHPALFLRSAQSECSHEKANQSGDRNMLLGPYTSVVADEDTVLEEAMDNLKEARQRIRSTQSLMRSQGMIDDADYRELVSRLSTSLAMVEAAYMEARRRG